jgi:hypothetical protein
MKSLLLIVLYRYYVIIAGFDKKKDYKSLKSTCDVNLLSKLSIIFNEWRVMNNVDRGGARV